MTPNIEGLSDRMIDAIRDELPAALAISGLKGLYEVSADISDDAWDRMMRVVVAQMYADPNRYHAVTEAQRQEFLAAWFSAAARMSFGMLEIQRLKYVMKRRARRS